MNIKNKNKRNGFTIVELVIVIAVIGLLSAILIPTFIGLVNRSNITSDQALVKNLNTALAMEKEENGKHNTMHETLVAIDEYGFNVSKITAKSKSEILYDAINNQFVLAMEKNEFFTGTTYSDYKESDYINLWKIYTDGKQIPEAKEQVYSIYLADNNYSNDIDVTVGFDAGNNTSVSNVTYDRSEATEGQEAIIRTNGGTLKVNAPLDTIKHYEKADLVNIEATADHSYHEFGEVPTLKVNKGRVVVELTGAINVVDASESTENVKLEVINSESVSVILGNVTSDSNLDDKKAEKTEVSNETEMQAALDERAKYIFLTNDIELSNSSVLVNYDAIIDGNNHKITATNNVQIGIRIASDNVTTSILNLEIFGGERGVQVDPSVKNTNLYINNCVIKATYYGINVCNYAEVNLSMSKTYVSAWGALNLWSAEYTVKVSNCTLEGINDKSYNEEGWNGFGTVVLEGDTTNKTTEHSAVIDVEIINTKIIAKSVTGNIQKAILFNSNSVANNVTLTGCEIILDETGNTILFIDNGTGNKLIIDGEKVNK